MDSPAPHSFLDRKNSQNSLFWSTQFSNDHFVKLFYEKYKIDVSKKNLWKQSKDTEEVAYNINYKTFLPIETFFVLLIEMDTRPVLDPFQDCCEDWFWRPFFQRLPSLLDGS